MAKTILCSGKALPHYTHLDKESVKHYFKIKLGQMLARACKERKEVIYSKEDNDPSWILGCLPCRDYGTTEDWLGGWLCRSPVAQMYSLLPV